MCYTDRQYDNRIRNLKELESLRDDINKQIEAIKADIQGDMGATEEVQTSHFRIRYVTTIRRLFNPTEFKKKHANLYEEFREPKVVRCFTWKELTR